MSNYQKFATVKNEGATSVFHLRWQPAQPVFCSKAGFCTIALLNQHAGQVKEQMGYDIRDLLLCTQVNYDEVHVQMNNTSTSGQAWIIKGIVTLVVIKENVKATKDILLGVGFVIKDV